MPEVKARAAALSISRKTARMAPHREPTVILNVTFRHGAKVIPPRKRNPQDLRFVHTVPVEIREFRSREMPIALRFRQHRMGGGVKDALQGLRWDGESLYRGVIPEESMADLRHVSWLRECAERGHLVEDGMPQNPFGTKAFWKDREESPDTRDGPLRTARLEDPDVGRILSHDRDEVEADIRRRAAGIVIVDDLVHVRCPEPVYVIHESGIFSRDFYRFAQAEFYNPDKHGSAPHVFRADELDFMVERWKLGNVVDNDRIEILIPEAVRHDVPDRQVLEAADSLLKWHAQRIPDRDDAFFREYRVLRDEVAAYKAARAAAGAGEKGLEPVGVDPSGLVAVVRETVEGMPEGDAKEEEARVRQALERLDARSLSADMPGPSF